MRRLDGGLSDCPQTARRRQADDSDSDFDEDDEDDEADEDDEVPEPKGVERTVILCSLYPQTVRLLSRSEQLAHAAYSSSTSL